MIAQDPLPGSTVAKYIAGVLSGEIVVGKFVRQAVERHVRDLERAEEGWDYYFDADAATHRINFNRFLRHSKGKWAGDVFRHEPWQMFIRWVAFGWMRCSDHTRRFRVLYEEVGRKNGKTTDGSGDGLYLMVADGEAGAEVYTLATKLDQAKLVHSESIKMVKSSPDLRRRVRIRTNNLSVESTGSKYEPLGSDSTTQDGLNAHGAIADELHAHKKRGLWDVIEESMAARSQPMMIAITTAGHNREGICWELREYCLAILDPNDEFEDDTVFAFIACLDEGDDWQDESVWIKANPNLDVTVNREWLREQAHRAARSPGKENSFRQKHMNEWTEQAIRFLPMHEWDKCSGLHEGESPEQWRSRKLEEMAGKPCYLGMDLSSKIDLTALMRIWTPEQNDGKWLFIGDYFVPEMATETRDRLNRERYKQWDARGILELTEGYKIDNRVIRSCINDIADVNPIECIGYDPWNATDISTLLIEEDGFQLVEIRQGVRTLSDPMKEVEASVIGHGIEHGNCAVLRWAASNLSAKMDVNGGYQPVKESTGAKIDPMVALFTGLTQALKRVKKKRSVYEDRGLVTLVEEESGK